MQLEALVVPLATLFERVVENDQRHRPNKPRVLGQGDELHGAHESSTGMLPAHQCLNSHDPAARELRFRLVEQHELLLVDCAA